MLFCGYRVGDPRTVRLMTIGPPECVVIGTGEGAGANEDYKNTDNSNPTAARQGSCLLPISSVSLVPMERASVR